MSDKLDCKVKLAISLLRAGEKEYSYSNYDKALEYFEECKNLINSNWQVKNGFNKFRTNFEDLSFFIKETCENIAKNKWSYYNTSSMEEAIYFLKSKNCYLPDYEYYYYLYKAYKESKSNRTSNLELARKIKDPIDFINGIFYPHGFTTHLYNKSRKVTDLQNRISQKENDIRNLKYELNSVENGIKNTQSMINAKKSAVSNKNLAITELNNLANDLITKGNEINNQTEETVNENKNQVKQVEQNIKEKKDFVEEITKLEKEKKDDIEKMKNNNKNLKEKNELLFKMLTALESKLN